MGGLLFASGLNTRRNDEAEREVEDAGEDIRKLAGTCSESPPSVVVVG